MLSRISFAGLYLIDVLLAYMFTEDYIVTAVTAAVIPVILFIWQKVTLFKSGATHISKCRRGDAELLYAAYHEVEERAKTCGYKIKRSAKLYISDEDTQPLQMRTFLLQYAFRCKLLYYRYFSFHPYWPLPSSYYHIHRCNTKSLHEKQRLVRADS